MNIKVLKKVLTMFLLGIVVFFINGGRVEADTTKCTYAVGKSGYNVTYLIEPDENGGATMSTPDFECTLTPSSLCLTKLSRNEVSAKNFINKNDKIIKCPSTLYYKIEGGGRTSAVTIKPSSFEGQTGYLSLTNSINDNQKLVNTSGKTEIRTCDYQGQNPSSSGPSSMPRVYITAYSDGSLNATASNQSYQVGLDTDVTSDLFKNGCPALFVNCGGSANYFYCKVQNGNVLNEEQKKDGEETKTQDELDKEAEEEEEQEDPLSRNGKNNLDCKSLLGPDVRKDIEDILDLVKVIVPIIIIVLGSVDFGKAVISSDEKALGKATSDLIKRSIIAVAIFFAPIIIMYIIKVVDSILAKKSCDVITDLFIYLWK